MKTLKLILKAPLSIDAIFKLRKAPLLITLIVGIMLSTMQMTPLAFSFLKTDTYRWDEKMWGLTEENYQTILNELPDCMVEEGTLTCTESMTLDVTENVVFGFNAELESKKSGIIFNETEILFSDGGGVYTLPYTAFEGFDFGGDVTSDDLFDRVAQTLKPMFVLPFIIANYQTGILVFFISIVIVSLISMLLKFGHTSFITFKELFNIMIYSGIAPSILVLLVGMIFTPGFETIIFQFGTPFIAYTVYRKKVIPYLHS